MAQLVDCKVRDLASPAFQRLVFLLEAEALPAAAGEIAEEGAQRVRGRAPKRTGRLASEAGVKPSVQVRPGAAIAKDELTPEAWYGRLQEQGWSFHPAGLNFFADTQDEMDTVATPIVDRHVMVAIRQAGL